MKQKAIICDIDGVLLDTEHINDMITNSGLSDDSAWEFFNRHANDESVVADSRIIEMLEAFAEQGYKIIFVTARSTQIWQQTRAKIDMSIGLCAKHHFNYEICMRGIDDKRPSSKVKQSLLNKIQEFNSVLFAIDDESENCEMYAKNNILTLKVHK